ncbi:MAG: hypothetical protein LBE91_04100 [Tannerella sp.]|jgi:hypothetical protein|nr:hypothetical protein [Tannerella sp.]
MKQNLIEWTITVWLSICIFASCSDEKDKSIIDVIDPIEDVVEEPTVEIEYPTEGCEECPTEVGGPSEWGGDPIWTEESTEFDPSNPLVGIIWKLVGFVDTQTGVLREPEPKNCDYCFKPWFECYLLKFDKDGVLYSHSSTNEMTGDYKVDYETNQIEILKFGGTKINEFGDGHFWWEVFYQFTFFILKDDELELYYNNKKNYLLFKRHKS